MICGAISQYNAQEPPKGPANYMQLLVMRASMTGFLVFDFAQRYPEGVPSSRSGSGAASSTHAKTSCPGGSTNSRRCS